jgi:hypothetical protein
MEKINIEMNLEKMNAPSYKLLVTTPMAAIMLSGKENREWSSLLKSIAPIYASSAVDAHGEVNEALLTVSHILQGGDSIIRKYFENENISFDTLMDVSATGADVWMCKLSDGEIQKPDVITLFKAIKAGLIETVGDLQEENEIIKQLIQTQDKLIKHISSLK